MPEPVALTPTVVEWARESAGLSIEQAARRLHVTPHEVARWEADGLLTVRQLKDAARVYGRPVAALLLDAQPPDPPQLFDFRVAWGVPRRSSPEVQAAIRATTELQELAAELIDEMGEFVELPELPARWWDDVETAARDLRTWLGVAPEDRRALRDPARALRAWRTVFESRGIFVTQASMPAAEVRGFSSSVPAPVVTLNRSDSMAARVYTLFHELVHVLEGTAAICLPQAALRRDPAAVVGAAEVERRCNMLAAAILVPDDELAEDLITADIDFSAPPADDDLRTLAARFSVSKFVLWYRLRDLGYVTDEVFHEKWSHWPPVADLRPPPTGGGGETRAETALRELGPRFVSLVISARNRDLLSTADALGFLRVHVEDLDELLHPARALGG